MKLKIKKTICPLIGAGIFLVVFGAALGHAGEGCRNAEAPRAHIGIGSMTSASIDHVCNLAG